MTSDKEIPPIRKDESVKPHCVINCDYDTPFNDLPVVDMRSGTRKVGGMNLTMRFDGETQWKLQVGKNTTERKVEVLFA